MSVTSWHPRRGEVVLVRFPFLESPEVAQAKLRPAVIVSGEAIHQETADVLIAAISSRPASAPLSTDYQIVLGTPECRSAGLVTTSWVKVSNLAAVPKAAVLRRLGRLTAEGLRAVDQRLRLALDLQ
jgi:mRNA-degrading endonuclease toxin of MazEF toxin-antitoxin module